MNIVYPNITADQPAFAPRRFKLFDPVVCLDLVQLTLTRFRRPRCTTACEVNEHQVTIEGIPSGEENNSHSPTLLVLTLLLLTLLLLTYPLTAGPPTTAAPPTTYLR